MSPRQAHILASALPRATVHLVPGEGHFSLFGRHARAIVGWVIDVSSATGISLAAQPRTASRARLTDVSCSTRSPSW